MNPLEQLRSVLCDPTGRCSIAGSDEDRKIVDRALSALSAKQGEQRPTFDEWTSAHTRANLHKLMPEAKQEQCSQVTSEYSEQEPVAVGEVVEDAFSRQLKGIGQWHLLPNGTKLYTNPAPSVNQQLLEACKAALSDDQPYIEKCRAAIAAVEGKV